MIKQDIVHHVIERTGLPRTKAEAAVDTVFEGLKEALAAGERIELRGFGVFSVRARKTGIGRNPRTGTEVSITPEKRCASSPVKNCIHWKPEQQPRASDRQRRRTLATAGEGAFTCAVVWRGLLFRSIPL